MDKPLISEDRLHSILVRQVAGAGRQKTWADTHGFSQAFVSEMVRGKRAISTKAAAILGYRRVVRFEEIQDNDNA